MGLLEEKTQGIEALKQPVGQAPAPAPQQVAPAPQAPLPQAPPVEQAPAPQEAMPPQEQVPPEQADEPEKQLGQMQLDPNQKAQAEKYANRALVLFYETMESQGPDIFKTQDPVNATAAVLGGLIQRLDTMSRKQDEEVDDQVKMVVFATVVTPEVSDYARQVGVPLSQEQQGLALAKASQEYIKGEVQAGRIDPKAFGEFITQNVQAMDPAQREQIDAGLEQAGRAAPKTGGLPPGAAQTAPTDLPVTGRG